MARAQLHEDLKVLGLKTQTINTLNYRAEIFTVKDLVALSEKELYYVRNIGPKTLQEIKNALKKHKLELAEAPQHMPWDDEMDNITIFVPWQDKKDA